MVTISNILEISHGCFRKKAGQLRSYFFKKNLGFFHFFTLSLEIPEKKTKLHPCKFCKIVLHPLEIPWPKIIKAPLQIANPTLLFLVHPWKFCLLFL